MLSKTRLTPLLLWLAVSCIAALSAALMQPSAHIGKEYFPFGNDSFYHATRILETVHEPGSFYEFDPKIHAPEGSLLVWPWGYDYVLAKVVRAALALGLGSDPLMVLLWIPIAAVFLGIGLLMLIGRQLGLGKWGVALAGLCMAVSPSTQLTYGFAQIDHHFAEHMCVLASLAAGLAWFRAYSVASGVALGVTFSLALAVHNALFVLLLPFLATGVLLWVQGKQPPLRATIAFALALLGAALAVLLPSQPFREGRFEFYMLSWFHLYVVGCTALVMVLLARLQSSRRNVIALIVVASALLAPLIKQIAYARSFVVGSLGMLDQILEMRSPLQWVRDGEFGHLADFYTVLVFLAPITLGLCVLKIWRERSTPRLLFWIWCVFGLALMATQVRMHYFGTFALFLPWLLVVQQAADKWPQHGRRVLLMTSLLLVLGYSPIIRHQLIAPAPLAGDQWFKALYPIFAPLRQTCAKDPGVVLTDTNAGHYVRYFSACSVIANNFLLTPQQFQKADEVGRLFSLPADQLTRQAPYVKYVLVRAGKISPNGQGNFSYSFFGKYPPDLSQTLLLGAAEAIPPEFKLVYTISLSMRSSRSDQPHRVPYARLFKIVPSELSAPAPSSNDVGE